MSAKPDLQNLTDLEKLRHSTAHLLAAAVLKLWPDTKITLGPPVADGFYYDFKFSKQVSENDLPKIEKQMKKILPTWKSFDGKEISPDEAREIFAGNEYKLEMINDLAEKGEQITVYTSGDFTDLCRGGHVLEPNKEMKHFALLKVAGAYWRGDENNDMLTRIYGTAFPSQKELDEYLHMLTEAQKRDHRKLGRELDLFTFSDLVGPGLPLWTPKGTLLRNILDDFVWQQRKGYNYERVEIPHITKKDLYEKSGHWDKFSEELFRITTREGHEFAMKPMNCPHHTQIFARHKWSYRDMPQRYANSTMCYRDEQSGELHGLSRTRAFEQDDAHVFCRMDQVKEEFSKIWDIVDEFYTAVGLTPVPFLSFHDPESPDKYLGGSDVWKRAESMLSELASERGVDAKVELGEAAFYGPKIDFKAYDSIGRQWQIATIQLDMNMPERFDLTCVNEQGEDERIVMIHAAIMGSIERFLSVIIEHLAGAFPVWMAPVQVMLASVGAAHHNFVHTLAEEFKQAGIRVEVDNSDETVGKKIRTSSTQKIPYTLVIGDKEMNAEKLQVRVRGQEDLLEIDKQAFIKKVTKLDTDKSLEL